MLRPGRSETPAQNRKDPIVLIHWLTCCVILAPEAPLEATSLTPTPLQQAARDALEAANAARDAAVALQNLAAAEGAPASSTPSRAWTLLSGAHFESVSGNASAINGGLDSSASGNWRQWGTDLKLSFAYGKIYGTPDSDQKPTAFNFDARARGERKYTPILASYALVGFLMDRVASIQDQEYAETGLSGTWIDATVGDYVQQRLRTGVGFRVTREARANYYPPTPVPEADRLKWIYAPAVNVSYRYGFTPHAFVTEEATFLFDVETGHDVRITSETALNMQLNDAITVALLYKVRYLGQPADGRKSTDTTFGTHATWSW